MSNHQEFWKTQQEQLIHKLSEFEQCVETPFIPGELESWLPAADEALQELITQVQLHAQHIHAEEFAEIAEEDPGLLSRVEDMREEDQSIAALSDQIVQEMESLQKRVRAGATETDLKQELDQFVSAGLEFVTRIRKQEVTVRTWLVEAFTRDRGTVD